MQTSYVVRKSAVKSHLRESAWDCVTAHAKTIVVKKSARSNYIKEWRVHRGMTQAALAEAAGLTDATISRIESGKIGYTQVSLESIGQALDVAPGDLLRYSPDVATPLWSLWERAAPDERRKIEALAETVVGWRHDG